MDITITKPEYIIKIKDNLSGKKTGEYLISAPTNSEARKAIRKSLKDRYDYNEGTDYKIVSCRKK